jgi:hypothetical protein
MPTEDALSQPEQPWQPGPNDLPFTTHLINPHGDRAVEITDVSPGHRERAVRVHAAQKQSGRP